VQAAPTGQRERLAELLAPLRADPARAAILTDVDGTIAAIAERPEEAEVPERARDLLAALAGRYGLVAALSGRRAAEARAMVGLGQIAYSGNHGFELLAPGDREPRADPMLAGHEDDARRFVDAIPAAELEEAGIRVEDKGAIVALHWRGAPDEAAAEAWAAERAAAAEEAGLATHHGRKVLEIRPPVATDKGGALASLLEGREISTALYAGDDRTDVDAFRMLEEMRSSGRLEAIARVAIASEESPPEVAAAADVIVEGPPGFIAVLEQLAA
jgi:trehalose-phosphatase